MRKAESNSKAAQVKSESLKKEIETSKPTTQSFSVQKVLQFEAISPAKVVLWTKKNPKVYKSELIELL